ncbi:MAG: L-ribulose-5-phosphate 3-epimerase [Anaerolineae bacterium]|nr:L-ribulose-5-phosphate 3-epimerase [Anaerolineae bacterium]
MVMAEYSLGLYEKAMPAGIGFPAMLELTARCGFDRLEISIDESDGRLDRLDWEPRQVEALRSLSVGVGVPIRTMCLSGHRRFPMGSHDPQVRVRSIEIMQKAIRFSAHLGVSIIQLAGYDVYYEPGDAQTRAYFAENLAAAVAYAAQHGVVLAFETMETSFMDTVAKSMVYVKQIDSPWLGVYPDIGNLQNAAVVYGSNVMDDIASGAGHLFAAHLKETVPGVYRDLAFGTGHTPYQEAIRALWRQGVRMYTGEFWYNGEDDVADNITRSAQFLRQRIEEAALAA